MLLIKWTVSQPGKLLAACNSLLQGTLYLNHQGRRSNGRAGAEVWGRALALIMTSEFKLKGSGGFKDYGAEIICGALI